MKKLYKLGKIYRNCGFIYSLIVFLIVILAATGKINLEYHIIRVLGFTVFVVWFIGYLSKLIPKE